MTRRETGFETATRVAAGDDGTTYDRVAIGLHWATALLVLLQFANAELWDYWSTGARAGGSAARGKPGAVGLLEQGDAGEPAERPCVARGPARRGDRRAAGVA